MLLSGHSLLPLKGQRCSSGSHDLPRQVVFRKAPLVYGAQPFLSDCSFVMVASTTELREPPVITVRKPLGQLSWQLAGSFPQVVQGRRQEPGDPPEPSFIIRNWQLKDPKVLRHLDYIGN